MAYRSFESRSAQVIAASAIGLLALVLRLLYSNQATVEAPISGDANQYVAYAMNLLHHATFSNAIPGSGAPVLPDAYRGPGYPALLYLALWTGEAGGSWYPLVLKAQAVLGAASAVLALLIGRRFLPAPLALLAALIVAVWPHLISINGYLLSETLFGFVLLLSLYLSCLALEQPRTGSSVMAGVASGLTCLVNPIYLLFPWLVAALLVLRKDRKRGLLFLVAAMALPLAWSIRNSSIPDRPEQTSRIVQNLVQGSWPLYHAAYMSRDVDPMPRQILAEIGQEERAFARDPVAGLRSMQQRFATRPWDYLGWYVQDKVYLLWDWDIRIGQGDIYIIHTENSPFETSPIWHAGKNALRWLNPGFFWASLLFSIGTLVVSIRRPDRSNPSALLLALFFLYVTGLHMVLQAEPRYSIPYRPVEILLAFAFIAAAGKFRCPWQPSRMQTWKNKS